MFRNLEDTIKQLNADVNNVANCEKAKQLRKRLLSIGLPMTIGGFLGVFVCFAMFAISGYSSASTGNTNIAGTVIPFILFIPFGVVAGIGSMITSLSLKIVITGYTSNLIHETVGNICPSCGETIKPETVFCPKCGTQVKNECPNCKFINKSTNKFCEKCGKSLDKK